MNCAIKIKKLAENLKANGMDACAITDHGVAQAFPEAMNTAERINKDENKIKVIYGCEAYFVDDFVYGKLVTLAVKSPVNKTGVFQNDICESDSIVRHYLYKDKVCEGLDGINIHQSLKDDLVNRLSLLDVSEAQLKNDVEIFDDWYARWYTINNMKLLDPVDVIKKGHQAEQVNTHNSDTPDLQNETLQLNKALP